MDVPRLSRLEIGKDLDESLQRMGVEVIDLYWLHRDDPRRPVGDMIETLQESVAAGKIRYYGCSNWSPDRMRDAQAYAKQHGRAGFVASQPGWSLAARIPGLGDDPTSRFMDAATYAFHQETGLPVAAYASQANGFFTGPYGRGLLPPAPGVSPAVARAYGSEANYTRLDRCRELAADYGCSANDIALAYLTSQAFPASAILGCGTLAHLEASLTARDLLLSADECRWLAGESFPP
jgi:aryl-alcohol dehydrogenase-like predicted oxidoreductase